MKKNHNYNIFLLLILLLYNFAFSQTPNWHWAKQAGGTSSEYGYGIAVDGSGNSFVTGSFNGTASFNGTSLSSVGGNDIFVAKYDAKGTLLWAKKAGGSNSDYGYGIALDGSGNSYVTGSFRDMASFNGTSLSSSGASDIFVAKYDASGAFQWAKQAGGGYEDEGN